MSKPNDHKKDWNSADIRRYLSGEMPAVERHAFEQAMLDDPFLADAVDGLRQRSATEQSADVADLEQRLANRVDEKIRPIGKASSSRWWMAAAAALFLLGGSIFWLLQRWDRGISELAKMEENHPTIGPAPDTAKREVQTDSTEQVLVVPKAEPAKRPQGLSDPKHELQPREELLPPTTHNPQPIIDNPSAQADRKTAEVAVQAPAPTPAEKSAPLLADQGRKARAVDGFLTLPSKWVTTLFKGQVLDGQGKPVPFANIKLIDGGPETYADAQGNFRIMHGDTAVDLRIHAVGFQDRNATLCLPTRARLSVTRASPKHPKQANSKTSQPRNPWVTTKNRRPNLSMDGPPTTSTCATTYGISI
jgi:CarboxypepD_reg-like domain